MNKKTHFLIFIFSFISIFTFSQNYPIQFGIKAGWNYSDVDAIDELGEPSGYLSGIIDEAYAGL